MFFSLGAYFTPIALENYRPTRCHYGAVRVCGDDAQPGRFGNRGTRPVAETCRCGLVSNFVSHHAGEYDCFTPFSVLTIKGIDSTPISALKREWVLRIIPGPYVLAVELASMLLLAGLVVAFPRRS